MYAVSSTTVSGRESCDFIVSRSVNACLKLESFPLDLLLLSHILSLLNVFFMYPDSEWPAASLSCTPIEVARPMSCTARLDLAPVLLLSLNCSTSKERDSGPMVSIFSIKTRPQLAQRISPVLLSVTIGPLRQTLRVHFSNISSCNVGIVGRI